MAVKKEARTAVIAAYGDALASRKFAAGREAALPFPKEMIREGLLQELLDPTRPELMAAVVVGYLQLESFLPDSDFEVVSAVESTMPLDRPLIHADVLRRANLPNETRERYSEILDAVNTKMATRQRELEGFRSRPTFSQTPSRQGKVVTYRNTDRQCFCQLKLPSGHRVLISIAAAPRPSVKVFRMALGGLLPVQTLWELNPAMAGGYAQYVQRLVDMFATAEGRHPLDEIRDVLLAAQDVRDVTRILVARERQTGV